VALAKEVYMDGTTMVGTLWWDCDEDTEQSGGAPDVKALMQHFRGYTREQFAEFVGNAKLNTKAGKATQMEKATLVVHAELKTFVNDLNEAMTLVHKVIGDSTFRRIPHDFKEGILDLTGTTWDARTNTIVTQSLDNWMNGRGRHNYLKTTLILIGASNAGKSELGMAIARELAHRHGHERFGMCKNLDAIGRLSMVGMMDRMGAFLFSDFELQTKLSKTPLSEEELKAFLDPNEAGGYDCRYHPALFAKWTPRIWTLNSGMVEGAVCYEWWFEQHHATQGLVALTTGDAGFFARASAGDCAIARRAFIIKIATPLYEVDDGDQADSDTEQHFSAGLEKRFTL